MLAPETVLFGGSLTAPSNTKIAKALGVDPTTVGRWRKDVDKMPYGAVKKMAAVMGYSVRLVRKEREYEG